MKLFSHNDRFNHIKIYWLILLNHPTFSWSSWAKLRKKLVKNTCILGPMFGAGIPRNEAGVPTTRLWSAVTCRQGCGFHTEAVRSQAKSVLCPSRWLGDAYILPHSLERLTCIEGIALHGGDWSGLRSACSVAWERVPDASWIGDWMAPSAGLGDCRIPKYLASSWNRTTIPRSSIP